MLLMHIPFHISRTCWTDIGLIPNMIALINVCFVTTEDSQAVPFSCKFNTYTKLNTNTNYINNYL